MLKVEEYSKGLTGRADVERACKQYGSLDKLVPWLEKAFKGWFIYRGGSHLALHPTKDSAREVLIVEK